MTAWVFLNLRFAKGGWFGPYESALLQAVQKYESIAEAAKAVDMNYQRAWNNIRVMNKQFGAVIVGRRGRGGGAHLTPKGEKLLKRYLKIEREFHQVFAKELRYIGKFAGDDPNAPVSIPRRAKAENK